MKYSLFVLTLSLLTLTTCKKLEYKSDCCTHEFSIYPSSGLDSMGVFAPNAFTPNSDGINDFFMVDFENISSSDFFVKIYQKRKSYFESTDQNFKWYGVIDEKVKEGVYDYFIRGKTSSGKDFEIEGKFCLLLNNDKKNTPIENCESCVFPDMGDPRSGLVYTTREVLGDCE